jgi:hypothetical protein
MTRRVLCAAGVLACLVIAVACFGYVITHLVP